MPEMNLALLATQVESSHKFFGMLPLPFIVMRKNFVKSTTTPSRNSQNIALSEEILRQRYSGYAREPGTENTSKRLLHLGHAPLRVRIDG
jgi:hypothetical protein